MWQTGKHMDHMDKWWCMIVSYGKWNRKCGQNLARNEFAICLAWVRHLVKLFWDRAWGLELHRWVQWTSFGREVLCNCYTVVFRGLKIVKALTTLTVPSSKSSAPWATEIRADLDKIAVNPAPMAWTSCTLLSWSWTSYLSLPVCGPMWRSCWPQCTILLLPIAYGAKAVRCSSWNPRCLHGFL